MKIENIVISGCSFVHGFDLCYKEFPGKDWNVPTDKLDDTVRQFFLDNRLSGKLKQHFKCEVHDLSHCGKDNVWIANSIINYIETNKSTIDFSNTLIMIGWSDPNREGYYLNNGYSSASLNTVQHSLKIIKNKDLSDPWVNQELAVLEALQPLRKVWHDNLSMINKYRDIHMSIILMLQLYLEKYNIRYVMWNGLEVWPKLENYPHSRMFDLSNIINWHNYYPFKGKDSYEVSLNDMLHADENLRTPTYHPNTECINIFYKNLVKEIEQRY